MKEEPIHFAILPRHSVERTALCGCEPFYMHASMEHDLTWNAVPGPMVRRVLSGRFA